jgi:hypothetical protein
MSEYFDSKELIPGTKEHETEIPLTDEGNRPATAQEREIVQLEIERDMLTRRLHEIEHRINELIKGN